MPVSQHYSEDGEWWQLLLLLPLYLEVQASFWRMEESSLTLKNEEGNEVHPTGEQSIGEDLGCIHVMPPPEGRESAGPGWSWGGTYDDVIRAAWQEPGDVAKWKRTWPTAGGLHGPLCQPHVRVWADQKKGSWRKKSEAVSSPWVSPKKMQSEMRTTLPMTVTAPLLHCRSSWWPWWWGHQWLPLLMKSLTLGLSIDLCPGRSKAPTEEQSHVANESTSQPRSRPNLAWSRGTGLQPLVEPVCEVQGCCVGSREWCAQNEGLLWFPWRNEVLCFCVSMIWKAKIKENTVTLSFHHGSNLLDDQLAN